jgi:hypothetical protein
MEGDVNAPARLRLASGPEIEALPGRTDALSEVVPRRPTSWTAPLAPKVT